MDPITSYELQVKSRLVCPDRNMFVADAQTTVLDSYSLNITGWTRNIFIHIYFNCKKILNEINILGPTIPTITTLTQESGNPDEEIRVEYTTPDAGVINFVLWRDFTFVLNDTSLFKVDTSLTPGTTYNYTVIAYHEPAAAPGLQLVSLDPGPTEMCTCKSEIRLF